MAQTLRADIEADVAEVVSTTCEDGCRGYISERRDFRFVGPKPPGVPLDVSVALCGPVAQLRAELVGLQV